MTDLAVKITPNGDVLDRFIEAIDSLGDKRARLAESRALNHTGDKAYTAVRKALIAQTSAPRAAISAGLDKQKAGNARLAYSIVANGRPIRLREFGAVQFKAGVRAKVWGRLQTYPHTFIVPAFGSNVFVRTSSARGPIRSLYGPGLANELVKDQSKIAFDTVAGELATRLLHELDRLFPVTADPNVKPVGK